MRGCDVCLKDKHISCTLSKKEIYGAKIEKIQDEINGKLFTKVSWVYKAVKGKRKRISPLLNEVEKQHNWSRKTRLCKECEDLIKNEME